MNLCITVKWISGEFHFMKKYLIKLKLILKAVYSISNNQIVLSYIVEVNSINKLIVSGQKPDNYIIKNKVQSRTCTCDSTVNINHQKCFL